MPAFGEVNTPADQLIWRQLIAKEKELARSAPRSGFSLRCAVNREEVPVRFKPGHIDPSQKNTKGFDPKAYGWDPQGELATEFRRCRKRSTAPPTNRFLFPETTAQENGWCQKEKAPKSRQSSSLSKLPPVSAGGASKQVDDKRRKERQESKVDEVDGDPKKRGLGKWASESQLSATAPLPTEVSAIAPSQLSSTMITELSKATSFPGVAKELVARVREQDVKVAEAMVEYNRYLCYGDRGNKHFFPLGETDATAYANAFTKATMGVPPHKWDPRASAPPKE